MSVTTGELLIQSGKLSPFYSTDLNHLEFTMSYIDAPYLRHSRARSKLKAHYLHFMHFNSFSN